MSRNPQVTDHGGTLALLAQRLQAARMGRGIVIAVSPMQSAAVEPQSSGAQATLVTAAKA